MRSEINFDKKIWSGYNLFAVGKKLKTQLKTGEYLDN